MPPNQIGLSLRKWTYSFAEILLFCPIILTIIHFFIVLEHRSVLLIGVSFIYFAAISLYDFVKIQSVWTHLLMAIAAGVTAAFVSASLISGAIVGTLCAYFWMRGMLVARYAPGRLYPDAHFWIGFIVYFVAYIPFRYYPPLKEEMYFIYTLSGAVIIVMALFLFNEMRLEKESLMGGKIKKQYPIILRYNRIYISCFLVIVTGMAYAASKMAFVNGGFRLSNKAPTLFIPFVPFSPGSSVSAALRQGERSKSSGFYVPDALIGKIVLYVVGAFVVYYVIRNLYRILRLLKVLFIRAYAWLRWFLLGLGQNPVTKTQDYEDEYSRIDFFEMTKYKSSKGGLQARIARLLAEEPRWEQLPNNREKIRYLYRHWMFHFMKKGYVFKLRLTN